MSKVIFNEAARNQTARYKATGCETLIVVRTDNNLPFQLDIESMSQSDPHFRAINVMTVSNSQDICLNGWPCFACGMDVIFRLSNVDANAHVFVEVLNETVCDDKCCDC